MSLVKPPEAGGSTRATRGFTARLVYIDPGPASDRYPRDRARRATTPLDLDYLYWYLTREETNLTKERGWGNMPGPRRLEYGLKTKLLDCAAGLLTAQVKKKQKIKSVQASLSLLTTMEISPENFWMMHCSVES